MLAIVISQTQIIIFSLYSDNSIPNYYLIYVSGPDLPFKLQLSQMVTSSDGVMLIGGDEKVGRRYKKEFLKLKSLNSEWEIQSKLHLSEGRNAHLVIPIPEEITNC